MGDFPLTTYRYVRYQWCRTCTVSQLVRSPSVYFNEKIDKNGRENDNYEQLFQTVVHG